jgi:hypothetical protein
MAACSDYSPRLPLVLDRDPRPVIRAERCDGQTGDTIEVADGVIGPGVADGRTATRQVLNIRGNRNRIYAEDLIMAIIEVPFASLQEDVDSLQEAIDRAVKGIRDPEAARKACEEMDRAREGMRLRFGERNLAVDLIRESRDEE